MSTVPSFKLGTSDPDATLVVFYADLASGRRFLALQLGTSDLDATLVVGVGAC